MSLKLPSKSVFIIVIIISIVAFICGTFLNCKSTQMVQIIEEIDTKIKEKKVLIKEHSCNDAIVDWVLGHSYRISRQTAEIIVNTSMSTDNGLLLIAIASRESSFSPTAISKKGAIGVNQIMPGVWEKELKNQGIIKERKDLFDCKTNITASNYILTKYYVKTGSWKLALKKYVGGKHNTYIKDVFATYGELKLIEESSK